MSDEKDNYIWQYLGYDDGYVINTDTVWRNLASHRANACEWAFKNGLEKTTTNGGEYQFDIKNMNMYVIDFGFVSPNILIRRILSIHV
jgi:hypothetical protein